MIHDTIANKVTVVENCRSTYFKTSWYLSRFLSPNNLEYDRMSFLGYCNVYLSCTKTFYTFMETPEFGNSNQVVSFYLLMSTKKIYYRVCLNLKLNELPNLEIFQILAAPKVFTKILRLSSAFIFKFILIFT